MVICIIQMKTYYLILLLFTQVSGENPEEIQMWMFLTLLILCCFHHVTVCVKRKLKQRLGIAITHSQGKAKEYWVIKEQTRFRIAPWTVPGSCCCRRQGRHQGPRNSFSDLQPHNNIDLGPDLWHHLSLARGTHHDASEEKK